MKADFSIFRGKDGLAYVRPGTATVQLNGVHANVLIRNFTNEQVAIVFPNPNGAQSLNLNPHDKQPIDLGSFGVSVNTFHVYVGSDEAQGNSSPTVIIDD